jgi:3-oxoadipate enol-lactonase
MFALANGINVHYVIDGPENAPCVTFVTGIANDTTLWQGQADALADEYRVLRYDLRGHGKSAATPGPYSVQSLGADLVALWDALEISKSHLVGLGLGGSITIGVAKRHADRLASVVPTCCRAQMVPDFAAMWHKLYAAVKEQGVDAIAEQTAQRWFSDDFKAAHPEVLDGVRAMIRGTSAQGYLGVVDAFLQLDEAEGLAAIGVPALLMGGAEDKVGGPPSLMSALAAEIPGARYEPIPRAAHIANIQNPQDFNRTLRRFLEQAS